MKLAAISCDARGLNDPTVNHQIVRHLGAVPVAQADVVVAFLSFREEFKFNTELGRLRKPWVLVDFVEDDWQWDGQENRLGFDRPYFAARENAEWAKLDQLVRTRPPILTFKRELLQSRMDDRTTPIDYLAEHPIPPTMGNWGSRRFEVLFVWGYSNPQRCYLHAQLFNAMGGDNLEVFDALDKISAASDGKREWISIYSPWFKRVPMAEVMAIQQHAKVSVSLPGAGKKCFRCSEAPVGCLPAFGDFPIARAYPWDETNSVTLKSGCEYFCLRETFEDPLLYDRYVRAQENIRRYVPEAYVRDYMKPNIQRCL